MAGAKSPAPPEITPPRGLVEKEGGRRRWPFQKYMHGLVGSEFATIDATVVDERAGGCRRVHARTSSAAEDMGPLG